MDFNELDDTFDYTQLGLSAEDYEFGQHLGDGGFGRVYQAVDKRSGREVAIKVLDKRKVHQRNMSSRVISEISIHQRLRHPFVLQLYSYFEDATNVYLVLELCHRGNLHDYVKKNGRLCEDKVRYFMKQIITGLTYLHQNRIMHRDLTLANLLLTKDNRVKISDFGLATEVSDDRTNKTMCGTPNYISPEVSSQGKQGLEVDVWSLGVMLYTMLVGKAPFDTKDPKSTIDNARKLKYEIPGCLNSDAIDLIAKLLRERPQDRLPLTDILQHPFMRKTAHERSASNDSGNDSLQGPGQCLLLGCSVRRRSGSQQRCHSQTEHSRHSDSQGYVSAAHSDSSPLQHRRPILNAAAGTEAGAEAQAAAAADAGDYSCMSQNSLPRLHAPSPTPQAPTAAAAATATTMQCKLSTCRLEACRLSKGSSVLTIGHDGFLTMEQVRKRRGQQLVSKLLRVSPDGARVQLASFGEGLPLAEGPIEFNEAEAEQFLYPQLSEQASRMYDFAANFIAILRSNTPKVTLYTDAAKCVLYENHPDPDFSVHFYSGGRARRSAKCPLSIDGQSIDLCGLTRDQAQVLHFVNETYDQIRRIESVLAGVAATSGSNDAFPAVIGRPPTATAAAAAAASAAAADLIVTSVTQPTSSSTIVQFNDCSRLELRLAAGSLQQLVYCDTLGHRQVLSASHPLPAEVQVRLRLLLASPSAPAVTLPVSA